MRYGLTLPNGGPWADPRSLAELGYVAEQSGWDGVFLEDYILWQGRPLVPTHDPWIALAAIAMRTERIRLGTTVTALPRRRPWKLASETVALDHLSNGRLTLGVGLGEVNDVNFTHFGELSDVKSRARMLDEALEVLVGLWSGEPFSHQGEFYHVGPVTLLPRPVQRPRIPIWVGGGWPLRGPVRRAARFEGACLYKRIGTGSDEDMTPADVREIKAIIESQRSGSAPFDIVLGGRHRGDDWEQDRTLVRSLAAAGATWWAEYIPPTVAGDFRTVHGFVERGPLRID